MLATPEQNGAARLKQARLLALILPAALLGGALLSQYVGGLYPCEMCYWQRWPHGAAILLALIALISPLRAARTRLIVLLAAFLIAISGAIGVFHAGVEWKLWAGPSHCTGVGDPRSFDIVIVRCDEAAWRLLGISLAGYNAILSFIVAAVAISWLRTERKFA